MRERPIPFSGPLVRALLEGRKTQTRRVLRMEDPDRAELLGFDVDRAEASFADRIPDDPVVWRVRCPYGHIGDRLYVRETIRRLGEPVGPERWCASIYAADGSPTTADCWPWKRSFLPPMHCPRGLSRITLEVTEVRIERLQAITEEDAEREGVTLPETWERGKDPTYRHHFAGLWDTINGKREGCSWAANPWVWVVSFRVAEVRT